MRKHINFELLRKCLCVGGGGDATYELNPEKMPAKLTLQI